MKSRIGISLVAMMALVGANTAQANAMIDWALPVKAVDFGDTTQVLGTLGGYTYVEAVTAYKTADLTVNGVKFLHLDTVGASVSYAGATHITQTLSGAGTNPGWVTPAQPDDYTSMLVSTAYLSQTGDGAITLAGLNKDTTYRVQLWTGWWDNDGYPTKYDGISLNPGDYNGPGGGNETPVPPPIHGRYVHGRRHIPNDIDDRWGGC